MSAPAYIYGNGMISAFNIFCASIILIIGIPGIVVNIACIIMLRKLPSFKNSFGVLCTSRCISTLLFLVIMVVMTVGPGLLQPVHLSYFISARSGQLLALANHATIISHVIIAVNRVMALFWTSMVPRVFNSGWLYVIIGGQWVFAALVTMMFSFDSWECNFLFVTDDVAFEFPASECSEITQNIDFYVQVVYCALLVLLNSTAFVVLMTRNRSLVKVTDRWQKQRLRARNIRFFVQEVIHGSAFLALFMSYAFVFPVVLDYEYASFVFGDGLWILVFAFDSLILVVFNAEMRLCVKRFFCGTKTVEVVHVTNSRIISNNSVTVNVQ